MKTVNIETTAVGSAADKLNSLADQWAGRNTTPPVSVGGGVVANELEELANVYQELNTQMVTLAQNTASFLRNVQVSFEEGDRKIASKLRE